MHPRQIELVAGILVLLLCGAAGWRTRGAIAPVEPSAFAIPAAAVLPDRYDFDSLGAAAEQTVATDPFRLANAPAAVRFQPRGTAVGVAMAAPPIPPPPRPTLVVRAIVGGPPWQAVVDGLTGQAGIVARAGDRFDKLVVARITEDSVIVQGPDTTWKLTLKRDRP